MKNLLILGNDRISAQAFNTIKDCNYDVQIVIDKSSNLKRIFRLLIKKKISVSLIFKMFICSCKRPPAQKEFHSLKSISSNRDLLKMIQLSSPKNIYLFRAGLIIDRNVINEGIPLMNIHCAEIPAYGGLGSIQRALDDNSFKQHATLHRVTSSIDNGEIHDKNPYELNALKSYCENENIAYQAGIELLKRILS